MPTLVLAIWAARASTVDLPPVDLPPVDLPPVTRPASDYALRPVTTLRPVGGDPSRPTFVALTGSPGDHTLTTGRCGDPPTTARALPPTTWLEVEPGGERAWALADDGTLLRIPVTDGEPAVLGHLPTGWRWVEPLWDRRRLLVARPEGDGLLVQEWPLDGGAPTDRWRDPRADDVVFDAALRVRYTVERETVATGSGFDIDVLDVFDAAHRRIAHQLLQPEWVRTRAPLPRVGDGPVHLLAGGDQVGLYRLGDEGPLAPVWTPPWGDAIRMVVGDDGVLDAVGWEAERLYWHPLTDRIAPVLALGRELDADVLPLRHRNGLWQVAVWSGARMLAEGVLDEASGRWCAGEPDPDPREWAQVEPLVLHASDGLPLAAYLTRPDPRRFGPPPWPLVVLVHGGPWSFRERWVWRSEPQRMADQGYAALAVNFRGSAGFGLALGHQRYGNDRMIQDVDDAIRWAIDQGVADPGRIAMSGASYGGYASLRFATAAIPRLRCAVAGAVYANLTTPGGRLDVRAVGSLPWRLARSPDRFTHRLSGPVLLWTGGQDGPHADEAVLPFLRRAERNGHDVAWLRFPHEGHGVTTPENDAALTVLTSRFLAGCLGGPALPIADVVARADLEVPFGADLLPGLAEALDARGAEDRPADPPGER